MNTKIVNEVSEGTMTEQEKANAFAKEYDELCNKHGFVIVPVPTWVSTNHGSFELVLKLNAERINK
jgi:hypothetical protein